MRLCITVLTLTLMLIFACGSQGPESAVDSLLSAVQDGDIDAIMNASGTLAAEYGEMTRSEAEEMFPGVSDLEWEILESEVTVNGRSATVLVRMWSPYLEDSPEVMEFSLTNSSDHWQVDDMINLSAELRAEEAECRLNMANISTGQRIYLSRNGEYAETISDLEYYDYMSCPEDGSAYIMEVTYAEPDEPEIISPSSPATSPAEVRVTPPSGPATSPADVEVRVTPPSGPATSPADVVVGGQGFVESYTLICPNGHGSVCDGQRSWEDEGE